MNAIVKAIVTEKSLKLAENGQYTFMVTKDTGLSTIVAECKRLFAVDVIDMHRLTIPGKVKRRGKSLGKRSDIHKVIITVKPGQKIKEYSVGE